MKGKGETRFLSKRVLWGLKKGGGEEMRLLMPIMVSWASIPPITWCHSTWQGVGWHNNICLFPLADFQREAWHRGEVRRREGKKKKKKRGRGGNREPDMEWKGVRKCKERVIQTLATYFRVKSEEFQLNGKVKLKIQERRGSRTAERVFPKGWRR